MPVSSCSPASVRAFPNTDTHDLVTSVSVSWQRVFIRIPVYITLRATSKVWSQQQPRLQDIGRVPFYLKRNAAKLSHVFTASSSAACAVLTATCAVPSAISTEALASCRSGCGAAAQPGGGGEPNGTRR